LEDKRKQKLMDLGASELSDALLELAALSDAADDLVERLIATPEENVQRFRKKIASLKRSRRFIGWGEAAHFARDLGIMLQDLKAGITEPLLGVELVAAFYETDGKIFARCDDSNGYIGDLFRYDGKELFVEYAARCEDKKKIAKILLKLNRKDDYGVRAILMDCAGECLPEPVIRTMIPKLQKLADAGGNEYEKQHHLRLIESLARQIKDPQLFEKTRIASWDTLSTAAFIDIARVYLESGDVPTAYSWVNRIPMDETYMTQERDKLLLDIYRQQGDKEKLTELLCRLFRAYCSIDTLQNLLDVIGEDKREDVVAAEVINIHESSNLRLSNVTFLFSVGRADDAETYLLDRAAQLDGSYYGGLLSLVELMEKEGRGLAASLIYRSLLVSILERGYIKAYSHGVRYLKKLDALSAVITDWNEFDNHTAFKEQVYATHGRKRSFWAKYEVKQ